MYYYYRVNIFHCKICSIKYKTNLHCHSEEKILSNTQKILSINDNIICKKMIDNTLNINFLQKIFNKLEIIKKFILFFVYHYTYDYIECICESCINKIYSEEILKKNKYLNEFILINNNIQNYYSIAYSKIENIIKKIINNYTINFSLNTDKRILINNTLMKENIIKNITLDKIYDKIFNTLILQNNIIEYMKNNIKKEIKDEIKYILIEYRKNVFQYKKRLEILQHILSNSNMIYLNNIIIDKQNIIYIPFEVIIGNLQFHFIQIPIKNIFIDCFNKSKYLKNRKKSIKREINIQIKRYKNNIV